MFKIVTILASYLYLSAPLALAQDEPAPAPTPAPAPAPDPSDYSSDGFGMDISAYGAFGFGWNFGVGGGAQFGIPVVPNGFIPNPKFRDALHVEFGMDTFYFTWSNYHVLFLNPMGGVRYTVYVLDNLAPFATVKFGASIPTAEENLDYGVYFYTQVTVGVLWDINDFMSLRAETGFQYVGHSSDVWRIGMLFRL